MYLVVFLFLILNAFSQPGPVQINEAGISNYQIQGSEPTTTPITGKQYLYNSNSVIKTKDSIGRFKRVNDDPENFVPNFDLEEGILPFVFTAGTTVLNTVNPLQGLRSIDFNPTLQNDFVETPLITIPPILMNGTCMIRVNIRGSDANTKLSVINGAGTEIGFKQLAVFTDSTPQFITFNCPTQALITATPALGQLKVKLAQSTATNSALATLDNFYLGQMITNQMVVSEGSQWYYYSVVADINGDFPFPAPTGSINDKTLFTYSGTTLTALKPIKIDFNISAKSPGGTNPNAGGWINCFVLGINRAIQNVNNGITATGSFAYLSMTGNLVLAAGDSCVINLNRTNVPYNDYRVNITATPLPQLATIVNTNTPRAGWLGQRTWASTNCAWTRSSAAFGSFTANAGCLPVINQGLVIPDVVTDGQLPKVTLSKLPKGKIRIQVIGMLGSASGSVNSNFALALNGTLVPNLTSTYGTTDVSYGDYNPNLIFTFNNPSELNNASIELFANTDGGQAVNVYVNNTNRFLNLVVSYEPDLSSDYAIPELFAVLPPQVQNSSGKPYRFEQCFITNAGTAAVASAGCSNWIQAVTRLSAGSVRIDFIPNIFSQNPICNCDSVTATSTGYGCFLVVGPSLTSVNTQTYNPAFSGVDNNVSLTCGGFN